MASIAISTYTDMCGDNNGDYYTAGLLYIGHDAGVGNAHLQHGWIGFVVNLPQGKPILSATLYWYATQTRADTISVNVGCEDVDDANEPTNAADILAKTLTSNYTVYAPSGFTAGMQYSVDVTNAVQEVLDRPGWVANAVLAILYKSQATGSNDWRRTMASLENTTYDEPQLVITYDSYVPQAFGVI